MQRLRTTFKRSRTPTPQDMKSQSSLEVPKQVRSASFDEIQLEAARATGASVLLAVPQPGARSRSFDSAGSDDSGTYLEVPRLWSRRRSGKGTPPPCVHCRHMETWLSRRSEERTTPERLPASASSSADDDDDDDESEAEAPRVLLAPPPPPRTFLPPPPPQSPPPSPGAPSFELQPPNDEPPILPQRRRSISRQEAFFVEPTGSSLENVRASEDCATQAQRDPLVHDIYLAVPELKRDRAASVDSCFSKVSGARAEELSGGGDYLTVPGTGLRSRSVDIVLPTAEQSRYKALALTSAQVPPPLQNDKVPQEPAVQPTVDSSFTLLRIVKTKDGCHSKVDRWVGKLRFHQRLKTCSKSADVNKKGTKVKMYFKKRWYFGTVILTETDSQNMPQKVAASTKSEFSDSDEEPLCHLAREAINIPLDNEDPFQDIDAEESNDPDYVLPPKKRKNKNLLTCDMTLSKGSRYEEQQTLSVNLEQQSFDHQSTNKTLDSNFVTTAQSNTIKYQENCYKEQHCEANDCRNEVFSSCVRCSILLCWDHFENDLSCDGHQKAQDLKYNQQAEEKNNSISSNETICMDSIMDSILISPINPNIIIQSCEVLDCSKEVFTSCFHCQALLCMSHYENQSSCNDHSALARALSDTENTSESPSLMVQTDIFQDENALVEIDSPRAFSRPEHFEVEGSPREVERTKINRNNSQRKRKELRNAGEEYINSKLKTIPVRRLGSICDVEICKKYNKECYLFDENTRENIFFDYWAQGNLQSQREFISRHIEKVQTKRKTAGPESRRQFTLNYKLSLNGVLRSVCKKMFLSTLNIGEMIVRTALKKTMETGVVEKEKRGGRQEVYLEKDKAARNLIKEHINRFPKVESHYCRENTTREYLNGDLTLSKMYQMFIDEQADNNQKPCFTLYCKIFHSMNLSFHKPKKDQCSLCTSYYDGSEELKTKLRTKFTNHFQEKILFRAKRAECKKESQQNPSVVQCATFDLQQVISLPISNESAVFYKRRLSVYNFTIYDMATGECFCYTWHEGESKRGACEISTALYHFLKISDDKGIKKVYLFADGCSGQNKNSITASTLMYIINNCCNIQEIVLRFSIPGHGQNEGDSAHSAINYAIKKSGNIFVPGQLIPVFKLARRRHPYEVISLQYSDMLDFKKISNDLKLLSLRTDNTGQKVNWTEMVSFQVSKANPTDFVFNTSHADTIPRKISLKRNVLSIFRKAVPALHEYPPKISTEKYNDLLSLTTGDAPVIKLQEYVNFYQSLPH